MPKINLDSMDSFQFDVLKELGNIGAGNATTALSTMIGTKIDMRVPKVELLDFTELGSTIGTEETIVVGILLTLDGDVEGMMMFLMKTEPAHNLVNVLMGTSSTSDDFNEMELSAMQEIGNIITGAYLSSLSDMTRLKIVSSIPYISIDMAGALLSVPAIEFGKIGDKVLLIETEFDDESKINGYFILIPNIASYDKILASLGL